MLSESAEGMQGVISLRVTSFAGGSFLFDTRHTSWLPLACLFCLPTSPIFLFSLLFHLPYLFLPSGHSVTRFQYPLIPLFLGKGSTMRSIGNVLDVGVKGAPADLAEIGCGIDYLHFLDRGLFYMVGELCFGLMHLELKLLPLELEIHSVVILAKRERTRSVVSRKEGVKYFWSWLKAGRAVGGPEVSSSAWDVMF